MMERDAAVRIVEEQLEHDFRHAEPFGRWTPASLVALAAAELTPAGDPCPKVTTVRGAGHRPLS
ncbi:hypothetical protein [Streptomyces griseosporeus]|uniref:hypothetical protein n=1 Tax=Streptomyces griseosporeus TaxID=1910 RepID=UPI0036FF7C77